jgi:uncharacterized protein YdhG (YjbR/CyaY superfamily)
MDSSRTKYKTVDEYIDAFPKSIQHILDKIRKITKEIVPQGEEIISYGMPTIKLNGKYVIYFAGFKSHIGLYPITSGSESFNKKIAPYVKGKGTLQFSLDKEIPYDLIKEIVKEGLTRNLERTKKY